MEVPPKSSSNYYNRYFLTQIFTLQLCPDQPCGATTAIGNGVTLGAAGTQGVLPCVAFSVGVDANEEQGIPGVNCKGDLIRINGEDYFWQIVSY